jgi:cytochrome b subunit of formate dehydrogenase
MRTKPFAMLSDLVLVALVVIGAVYLFLSGFYTGEVSSDRPILPLSVDGSRILLALAFAGILLGLVAARGRVRRTQIEGDQVTRYSLVDRLVHWAIALGFILDFATAIWLLQWIGLDSTVDNRPTLYLLHYVGAGLIVLAGTMFVTATRVRGQDALFPRWSDLSPAIARLFGYLGVYGQSGVLGLRLPKSWQGPLAATLADLGIKPSKREGKFLAVEKVFSFTPLAILAVVVVATGLLKSAHYFFTVPQPLLYWTTWLHDLAAWGTLLIVGLHLAAIFLVPRNWGGIRSMIFGSIPFRAVEHEFPAWADELRQRQPRDIPAQGVPVHGTGGK